jgi:hypothetical protein
VTGSTALGDTLDPEDVRALMSRIIVMPVALFPSMEAH